MKKLGVRTVLLVIGCGAIAAGLIVGISDNLPGIALVYGGIICLILAAVCRWQRPKSFFLLFALSAVGFVVFAFLHNLFYALGEMTTITWVKALMEGLHVAGFLIAILVCPAGVVVGLIGWIVSLLRARRELGLPAG